MKLKKVCLFLFGVLFLLLLNEISCIANYNQDGNLIGEDDRRAAEVYDKETVKRGLYDTSVNNNRHQTLPSGYDHAATFSSPGYAYSSESYPPSPYHSTGHGSYGLYGPTGHNYAHSAPSYGHHGGGFNSLALKGLLIPLAGIALLGAAAALSSNPVLLQLGVVNGRKRRRRSYSLDTSNPRIRAPK